ncbi:MAG: MFS transporter [Alphaproteobacteria bacterium]|nr:MFS transporter [Alphaproteobacteria bacterium]
MTSVTKTISRNVSSTFERVLFAEKGSFTYWRMRILYSTIIGYAAFYLVRSNFSMCMPGIMEEFGYSKVDLGWIASLFSIVYGIGKFINGYLSDRSDARYFMVIGLFLSAIVSLLMGFSSGLLMFALLWGLNGCFQSMGWPPNARLITHWFSPTELGSKWALWASSHQIGAVAIFGLGGFLIEQFGWRSAFIVPSFVAIGLTFFLFNRLRDTPQQVGLPPVEEYKGDAVHVSHHYEDRITLKEVLTTVLANKLVWFMAIANMCLYVPRMGILFWAPTFLKEYKGVTLIIAGMQLVGFEIASLIGGIAAGWISDKFFLGRRGPVGTLFLIGLALSLFVVWKVPAGYPFIDAFVLMITGFLLNGPQVLNGVATADFASKRAVGVATGVTGVCAYAGSAIAGVGIGLIVERYGWEGGFLLFILSALVGAFFFALTWNNRAKILDDQSEAIDTPC